MRRLQRIRDTTAEAIQAELDQRRRTTEEQRSIPVERRRVIDAERVFRPEQVHRDRAASSAGVPDSPMGGTRLVYKSGQRDKGIQTTGPSFAPMMPEIRTEVRTEVRIPENVYIVPGNQCFHIYNPCHAFRHRGTQGRVQTLRVCEYCVRHQGRDPVAATPGIDDILRSGQTPNFDRSGVALG